MAENCKDAPNWNEEVIRPLHNAIRMQQIVSIEGPDNRRQSARVIEIFHEKAARGHEIYQGGSVAPNAIPIVERQWNPDSSGDREQMDHRVGRTPNRAIDTDSILESLFLQDFRKAQILVDHLHNAASGHVRQDAAARVNRRNGSIVRQGEA